MKAQKDIPQKVIVELVCFELDFRRDAELPVAMKVRELRKGLLVLLKQFEPKRFSRVREIMLSFQETDLPDDATLMSVGAWDGSVLEIRKAGTDSPNGAVRLSKGGM